MICDKKNFIFLHIPKCGGSLIEKHILRQLYPELEISKKPNWMQLLPKKIQNRHRVGISGKTGPEQHKKLKDYKLKNDLHKIYTIVRNPWDRYVSVYFYNRKVRRSFKRKFPNFKSWVKKGGKGACNRHTDQQLSFINALNDKGEPIKVNIFKLEEGLYKFNDTFFDDIGIPKISNLKKVNASKHKHYTEYYDDETREIVAEKYAKDIEYFGYEFGE